jgi:hypothetical protein
MNRQFYIDASINLLGFLVCALLCVIRPALVLDFLRLYSRPGSRYGQLPVQGEEFDKRLRSVRHLGIYFLGLTLFMGMIVTALFYRSIPHKLKPSLFSNQPSLTHH